MRQMLCVVFLISFTAVLGPPTEASAQTSIGYSDPQDVSNLLDYRLPDWSYRVWDASFNLGGGGREARNLGQAQYNNNLDTSLSTDFSQTWESEQRHLAIDGDIGGEYRRANNGTDDRESRSRRLSGDYDIGGRMNHYLGDGPIFALVSARSSRLYSESKNSSRVTDEWIDNNRYFRRSNHALGAGVGWGRVRNVVPLLRAERLSERLIALGRPPLTSGQVQKIARVLAKEFGYREVFDRASRHFWDDVLTPMLEAGNPLTPYEIFYLTDVLNESLGDRNQGFEVGVQYAYVEGNSDDGIVDAQNRTRGSTVDADWYRNMSLTQQIHINGNYHYGWLDSGAESYEIGSLALTVSHLWNLADRYRLDTSLGSRIFNSIEADQRSRSARLGSRLNVYLEDQVSLFAGVDVQYTSLRNQTDESFDWKWSYRLGMTYHLDRVLF